MALLLHSCAQCFQKQGNLRSQIARAIMHLEFNSLSHDEVNVLCGIVRNIEVPLNFKTMASFRYAICPLKSEAIGMPRDPILQRFKFKMPISFFDTPPAENIPSNGGENEGFWIAKYPNSPSITEELETMFRIHFTQMYEPLLKRLQLIYKGITMA